MRTVTWFDDSRTIIRIELHQSWTWEDFAQAYDEVMTIMLRSEHTIHCIVDMSSSSELPHGNPWGLLRRMAHITPCNRGMIVHVGGAVVAEAMCTAFDALFDGCPTCVQFVDTMTEAYEICGLKAA
jgi:hypothetical protein